MSDIGEKLTGGPLNETSRGFWGNLKMIRPAGVDCGDHPICRDAGAVFTFRVSERPSR